MSAYQDWFSLITGFDQGPHDWQRELASSNVAKTRLIRVPTGLGKTEGVLAAWLYHAVAHGRGTWPRRLVWCLPMRVLVEQTAERARELIDRWFEASAREDKPPVHILMGGEDTGRWYLAPTAHMVLVGTQDMLLSRALNRGYASGRARWPVEYGLLNHDCLWVMDEVQLMDVGLATSAQLQAFRDQDQSKHLRPCYTWWMSATLQREWLRSIDTEEVYEQWVEAPCVVPHEDRHGGLWEVSKSVTTDVIDASDATAFAARILSEHDSLDGTEFGRITLVVCNTVERALTTYEELQIAGRADGLELVHSRFRPAERAAWRERFLSRSACTSGVDRIIVATQVVEAGVDMSAGCLITELAPWPSLVQRFGRCARYGGAGRIVVIDRGHHEKSALPYETDSLASAWDVVRSRSDVGLAKLEAFEDGLDDDLRDRLYSYQPAHLLMRAEYEELFDTTPDLTGADLDISRFIRSGDERDLQVFWVNVPKNEKVRHTRRPNRAELCSVPFLRARNWLCGEETKSRKKPRLRDGMHAWVWDWIDGEWGTVQRETLVPGRVICVDAHCGGYSTGRGFSPDSRDPVPTVAAAEAETETDLVEQADNRQDGEPLSISEWKTIAFHSSEVAALVGKFATELGLADDLTHVLALAARWHDVGKAHPAFQGKIRDAANESRPDRSDLAKAPASAWLKPPGVYRYLDGSESRPAFRHELASALALFSVLRLHAPGHPAGLGPWKDVLEKMGQSLPVPSATDTTGEIREVLACTSEEFDLLVYLVASHHGKVRVALHAAPADQDYQPAQGDPNGLPIRGVRNGDRLPAIVLTPDALRLPELRLTLEPAAMGLSFETGASWRERTHKLIRRRGPAALAFLEAILRAADVRASQLETEDPTFARDLSA